MESHESEQKEERKSSKGDIESHGDEALKSWDEALKSVEARPSKV